MKISPAVAQRIPRSSLEEVQQVRCSLDKFALNPAGLEARQAAQNQANSLQSIRGKNALELYRGAALAESRAAQGLSATAKTHWYEVATAAAGVTILGSALGGATFHQLQLGNSVGAAVIAGLVGGLSAFVSGFQIDESSTPEGTGIVLGGIGFTLGIVGGCQAPLIAGGLLGGLVGAAVASCCSQDLVDWSHDQRQNQMTKRLGLAQGQKALVLELLDQVVQQGPLPEALESDMLEAKIVSLLSSSGQLAPASDPWLSQAQQLPRSKVLRAAQSLYEIQAWKSNLTDFDPQAPQPLSEIAQLTKLKGKNALEMIDSARQKGGPLALLLQATKAALAQHEGLTLSLPAANVKPSGKGLAALESTTDRLAREAVKEVLNLGPSDAGLTK